ncbi:MAG: hypothetical protein GWM93_08700, partial [Gemmatimonadetes bacterium]|nr:hypothetical protein [Gemmatimonadota bacterium]NIT66740.1 hypothetical protein [Gemmatimonadota bacterium]NIY35317.1 hypothetical protein [Gemmatimonadota bacterium]
KAPPEQFVLDNEECAFQPHVMGAVTGQLFIIENSDPVLHNTHIRYGRTLERARRTVFNGALSFHEGEPQYRPIENPRVLRRPGWIDIECDAHEWMQGYGRVLEHPYFAVTDANGGYEITEVPPG